MDELNLILRRIIIHPAESLLAVLGIVIAAAVLSGTTALISSYDATMDRYSKMPQARQIQLVSAYRTMGQGEAAVRLDASVSRNIRFSLEDAQKILEENPSILTTYQARYMRFSTSRTGVTQGFGVSTVTQQRDTQTPTTQEGRPTTTTSTVFPETRASSEGNTTRSRTLTSNQTEERRISAQETPLPQTGQDRIGIPQEAPPPPPADMAGFSETAASGITEQVDNPLLEQVQGYMVSPEFFTAYNLRTQEGSLFDSRDVTSRSAVAVVGAALSKKLFDDGVSIGKRIRLNNRIYRIIGVLAPYGYGTDGLAASFDDLIFVPTLAAVRGTGGAGGGGALFFGMVDELFFAVREGTDIARVAEAIEEIANRIYGAGAVKAQTSLALMKREIQKRLNILYLLTFLAATVGFAATVNIFNLMMGRVSRRTKALAIQRSIGATQKRVFMHIILESALLSGMGVIGGAIAGMPLGQIVQNILESGQQQALSISFRVDMVWLIACIVGIVATAFAIPAALDGASTPIVDALREE